LCFDGIVSSSLPLFDHPFFVVFVVLFVVVLSSPPDSPVVKSGRKTTAPLSVVVHPLKVATHWIENQGIASQTGWLLTLHLVSEKQSPSP
jgi:hypothetical protein